MEKENNTTKLIGTENKASSHHPYEHIVILGSGFAGIEVLKRLQKEFHNTKKGNVQITLVSRDNFLLFTPMLPEVSTGRIETRHIVTPVRSFIKDNSNKNVRFYQANVARIDFHNKQILISHSIDEKSTVATESEHTHTLYYDYLVIALGSETNYFGLDDMKKHALTMKDIDDAIALRNHILNMLEQANLEHSNNELRKSFLTFVVVGGGFNGIETVGELNDFVKETVREYYKNIYMTDIRVVVVNAGDKILEQIDENLGRWALDKLKSKGVEFIMNTQATGATADSIKLDNGETINTRTIVWSTGVKPSRIVRELDCKHDKQHRIISNSHLEVIDYEGTVYAVGDCASITNPNTGNPYPPTAQHALKEARVVADNLINQIKGDKRVKKNKSFDYKTKGMMAEIGKRTGIATLFEGRIKLHGFIAWWLWRTFYLSNLPTKKKKIKVVSDWTMDLFFKPDVAMIKRTQLDWRDKVVIKIKEKED
ncbi:MAG: NAD(P)/FAD-dependent oxidoreductase [Nitrososphaeraceae archaeon]